MAKVLLALHDDFLGKVDEMAKADFCSRSDFIRRALRYYLRRHKQLTSSAPKNRQVADRLESLLFD